jgi:hypothetical protein
MTPRRLLLIVSALLLLAACKKETKLKVTDMDPMTGDFTGERVTFSGHGFRTVQREVEVFFGTRKGYVRRISDDEIVVDAPGGEVNEEVEVLLIFEPGGEYTVPKKFKYVKHEAADVGDLDTSSKKK